MAKKYIRITLVIIVLFFSNTIYSQSNSNKMKQSETPKNENRVQVILTLDMENLPENFSEILKEEQEVVAKWKAEGILEHLYLRQQRNGAVLVLKNIDEAKARELIETLPFYKLKKSIEYHNLIKQY
jgi:hypothetical protein